MKIKSFNFKPSEFLYPVVAILISLLLGGLLMSLLGFNALTAYDGLLEGSMGSLKAISESLNRSVPIILTGLSFAVARRCGMMNLGAEGQLYIGAMASVLVGAYVKLPPGIHMVLSIMVGFLGGALYGCIVGFLKNRFKANELIVTIMLNYIAASLVSFLIAGPFKGQSTQGNFPQSAFVMDSAKIPYLINEYRLQGSVVIALLMILFYYLFLWHTKSGYELRVVGLNRTTATCAGMNLKKNYMLAMFVAGGLSGLAGATELLSSQYRIIAGFTSNYGFDGVSVALVGNCTPIGILLSGLLFGMFRAGANKMQILTNLPSAILQVIQSMIVIFVVGKEMFDLKRIKRAIKSIKNTFFKVTALGE